MTKPVPQIILASKSQARRTMLDQAGLDYEAMPADIDEAALMHSLRSEDVPSAQIALELAATKAIAISEQIPESLVIGSDQILEFEGQVLSKAPDIEAARVKLKTLRGKTHQLISAVSIARSGKSIWSHVDTAILSMHDFGDDFLEIYITKAGDDLTSCVGAYALESHGAWLFSDVKGNHFTVLGMPLLPLLGYLKKEHHVGL